MKILRLYTSIASLIPTIRPALITPNKICRDCKYFIVNNEKCGKFGNTNIVTGKQSYEYAVIVRDNAEKCGEGAKHFEQNNYKMITVPYYFLLVYWPVFGYIAILLTVCYRNSHQ